MIFLKKSIINTYQRNDRPEGWSGEADSLAQGAQCQAREAQHRASVGFDVLAADGLWERPRLSHLPQGPQVPVEGKGQQEELPEAEVRELLELLGG